MNVGARVEQERKALGMSQQALADKVIRLGGEISQGGIDKLEKRDSNRPRYWRELAIALDVSDQWLLTGKGTKQRQEGEYGVDRPPSDDQGKDDKAKNFKVIPEINVRAGAGGGGVDAFTQDGNGNMVAIEDVAQQWGIPGRFLREELRASPAAVRLIEIMGDSMSPTLKPGDRVFVDTNHKAPSPPGVYVVWDGFGVVVKRVELIPRTDPPRVLLISDNSSHRQYELTLEEAHIVGRVIGKISLM